jgi:hypothetical protein
MKHPFYPSSSILSNIERKTAIACVACLLLGFLAGWSFGSYDRAREDMTTVETPFDEGDVMTGTTTATGTVERGLRVYEGITETLRLVDQKAGGEVYVAGVALSRPGWVAVREEQGGEGGRILGARWFPEGDHEGSVELLRNTTAGGRYHAYLFLDDGDKEFDPHKDVPITRNGLLILTSFTAQ